MKTKEIKANGFLTAYGFSCGYQETRETDFTSVCMYKEFNVYHVISNNFFEGGKREWNSFDKLSEAKKYFFKTCDKLKLKRIK